MKNLNAKNKFAILLFMFFFIVAISIYLFGYINKKKGCSFEKKDIKIATSYTTFVSINNKSIEESNGEIYLLIGITPSHILDADVIYNAAKCGDNIFVTINDSYSNFEFKISDGLYQGRYLRVKCKSIDEARKISAMLALQWNE